MFLHHHHHRCKKVLTCKYRCAPNLINSVILVSISQTNKKLFFGGFHQPLPTLLPHPHTKAKECENKFPTFCTVLPSVGDSI